MRSLLAACALLLVSLALVHGLGLDRPSRSLQPLSLSELTAESATQVQVDAAADGTAVPGTQCFAYNKAIKGEEAVMLYSYKSFCQLVVSKLGQPFPNEAGFRQACVGAFGLDECRHQCRELAQLFDQAIVVRQAGKMARGNQAQYVIKQNDCENCLRFHQCTPATIVV